MSHTERTTVIAATTQLCCCSAKAATDKMCLRLPCGAVDGSPPANAGNTGSILPPGRIRMPRSR